MREAIGVLPKAGESGDAIHDLPEKRSKKIQKLIRSIPFDGGSRNDLPRSKQLECHKRCNGFKDVYGRMAWDGSPNHYQRMFQSVEGPISAPIRASGDHGLRSGTPPGISKAISVRPYS